MQWWFKFWTWCSEDAGWQSLAGIVYLVICIFDFVIVPSWIGITRVDTAVLFQAMGTANLDPIVQMNLIESLTYQHEPFTLKGGGLFHLAFGALLTGSAITHKN